MKNQVCTINQMKALKELGVDISKASMCRVSANIGIPATDENRLVENDVNYYGMTFPVFTVIDMLDIMLDSFARDEYRGKRYELVFNKQECYYLNDDEDTDWMNNKKYYSYSENFKDAVYGTLLQLAKDGKL